MPSHSIFASIRRQVSRYGLLLGAGTFALQWIDYRVRSSFAEVGVFLVAGLFLALGVAVGIRLLALRQSD